VPCSYLRTPSAPSGFFSPQLLRCFLFGQVSALSRALARASCSPAVGAAPAPSAEAQAAGAASRGSWRAQPHAQSTCRSSALHRCDPYCSSAQPSVAPRNAVCLTRAPAPAGPPPEASWRWREAAVLGPRRPGPLLAHGSTHATRHTGRWAELPALREPSRRAREQPTKAETRGEVPRNKKKKIKE
jgi:hypothetical protein